MSRPQAADPDLLHLGHSEVEPPASQLTVVRSTGFSGKLTATLLMAALPLACAAWVMAALMVAVGSNVESRTLAAAARQEFS